MHVNRSQKMPCCARALQPRPIQNASLLFWFWAMAILLLAGCSGAEKPALEGIAVLPADTFSDGPTSGQFIKPANKRTSPFINEQSVQGFSAILKGREGSFLVMTDNGFGSQKNSPDYLLRVYRIRPELKTATGGEGAIAILDYSTLHDPDHQIVFPIIADAEFYPGDRQIPVDSRIRAGRLLTGADFDIESFRRLPDGTFYFGDEFGPFLLHTDSTGKMLDAPIPLPGVQSPQNPYLGEAQANLPRSGGFEGMAMNPAGTVLYPMLEKPLAHQLGQLNIYEFEVQKKAYSHTDAYNPPYKYKLHPDGVSACEFTAISERDFLVIERDGGEGPQAKFKKVFQISLDRLDADGFLVKTEVLDLLAVHDPNHLASSSGHFAMPFETIEALAILDDSSVAIINDNNYPFSVGRHALTSGEPDDSELVIIRLGRALPWGR